MSIGRTVLARVLIAAGILVPGWQLNLNYSLPGPRQPGPQVMQLRYTYQMNRRTYAWLSVFAMLAILGCSKAIWNTVRVEPGSELFTREDCAVFDEAVETIAKKNKLTKRVTVIEKEPIRNGEEVFFSSGYGADGETIGVECSSVAIVVSVHAMSIDPFGKIRTRSQARITRQLVEVLSQQFASRSRSVSLH